MWSKLGQVGHWICGWNGMGKIFRWGFLVGYYRAISHKSFLIHKWRVGEFKYDEMIFFIKVFT